MRVRISDLILWQWRPSLVESDYGPHYYTKRDERIVRVIMEKYRTRGINTRGVPPVRVRLFKPEEFPLSPKALKMAAHGKLMVWDGFHRIYAARRLGYKTIRVTFG